MHGMDCMKKSEWVIVICIFVLIYGYHSHMGHINIKSPKTPCSSPSPSHYVPSTMRRGYSVPFSIRGPSFQRQFPHFVLLEDLADVDFLDARLSFDEGWDSPWCRHLDVANHQTLTHLALYAIDAVEPPPTFGLLFLC